MAERSFLNHLLARMAQAGQRRRAKGKPTESDVIVLADRLLHEDSEAESLITAIEMLNAYEALPTQDRPPVFSEMLTRYDADTTQLESAIAAFQNGEADAARALHFAAEPRSQELIRRLNRVPGATARLVNMRADLLIAAKQDKALKALDRDFQHLFSSWFSRGFLEIRRIDWNTPARILEKIIAYEAVHEITGWDDLRQRVADPDRRLFAFFHPAMPSEPLIFVEVALTKTIPEAIGPIIAAKRDMVDPALAKVAVFYSISNCQKGLRGISFGNFLIKQVVSELQNELPGLKTFVTLSPVPGLRRWAKSAAAEMPDHFSAALSQEAPDPQDTRRLAAYYLTKARRPENTAFDPVAHFHLGNGAELHRIHADADTSPNGRANSWGVMVNYLYDGDKIEANHQAYTADGKIVAAASVRALAKP